MKVYRIKHIPTGLYYTPVKTTTINGWHVKTNLNKNGELYIKKPSAPGCCSHGFNNHLKVKNMKQTEEQKHHGYDCFASYETFVPSDWKVEEVR